jgi:2-polyprenyl-3-methyl-5-hydroxy-6-metoxy-1,4-benzoquinol methylase
VQLSKSCVGESPPWVQIPPSPPFRGKESALDDSAKVIAKFKTQAWSSRAAAARYARQVNQHNGLENIYLEIQVNTVRKLLAARSSVVDIGAGTGALSLQLAKLGYDVTAIDISKEMLSQLRKRDKSGRIKTIQTDIFDLQVERTFAAAVSRWVLPHFKDWERILPEVGEILESGGLFIFDFPNREHVEYVRAQNVVQPGKIGYEHWEETEIDPYSYYSSADSDQLKQALEHAGFSLEARVPFGLIRANALLSRTTLFSASRIRIWFWKLAFRSKHVQELVEAIEDEIIPTLPFTRVHSSLIVARKI